MRCPCCEALVSEVAFHKRDLLATFLFGDSVLGWDKVHKALKLVQPFNIQLTVQKRTLPKAVPSLHTGA